MKHVALFLLGLVVWLIAACPIQATVVDDWRIEGSQNELWQPAGDKLTGYSQHHFTNSFFVSNPTSFTVPESFVFRFKLTPIQGTDHNFVWNFQNTENYYQAHFNGGAVWISRFIEGEEMLSVGKNFSTSLGQTYEIELRQVDNRLILTVDDQEVVALTDLTHNAPSSGRVGFKLSPGTVVPVETHLSEIVVHDAAITLLPIGLFKQNDSQWGALEYDSAIKWSVLEQPTIARWGCALTSLTMIMRYYGLTQMPAGQPVNPETVNQWLIEQEDGYLGQGLVNWFATTRLIRQINERYSTPDNKLPQLEFSYQGWPWREVAKDEILVSRPLIAQVPGHFTVVNGYDERDDGFLISDPLYSYQYLSQHQAVLSLRLFRPSQTDLSALVVVHQPTVKASFIDQVGQVVSQTWQEYLETGSAVKTESRFFTVVFRPSDGVYKLELMGVGDPEDIQVLVYDQRAHLTLLPLPADFAGEALFVDFAKVGETVWIEEPAAAFFWRRFLDQATQLQIIGQLTEAQFLRLSSLAQFASVADDITWSRYKTYIQNILEWYGGEIDVEAKQKLIRLLS